MKPVLCYVVVAIFCLTFIAQNVSACCPPDKFEGFRYQKMVDISNNDPYPQVGIDALRFHYDFENEKTLEQFYFNGRLVTQITLYQKGLRYNILKGKCTFFEISWPLRRRCLPKNARFIGSMSIGDQLMDYYESVYDKNYAVIEEIVTHKDCIPITNITVMKSFVDSMAAVTQPGAFDIRIFANVTVGIKDPTIFDPPTECQRVVYPVITSQQ
ncbi:Ependymin-related protein 2 [Trichoplax sp. H2]|uniref:Uncharacterized protein n=1 Tax=Trichoplax adhaerens TaxID=10228 RepID=B3RLT6_TRIAD|nr:hypothetical protein TRIADDRAFT_52118 [Trichoplax adhaerens]EDV28842.1 hypothetical protein TRIADDRAFT_52118 [Trichoplax adhaerens]RDD39176.1 Ependymin-related protein 2 [Trichoplax sp. H2]|eukprot:XP_002108044.1 hypothetical protein TRIADDRAFT_52118 [Trichoplax adhaerens]